MKNFNAYISYTLSLYLHIDTDMYDQPWLQFVNVNLYVLNRIEICNAAKTLKDKPELSTDGLQRLLQKVT